MKTKYFFILIGLALMYSCNDDFLEKVNEGAVSTDTFFATEQDLYFATNALYNSSSFRNMYLENITDNSTNNHTWDAPYDFATGAASSYDNFSLDFWRNNYQFIQTANRIIEGAQKTENISEAKRQQYISEAKFHRALMYDQLVGLFGDVPFLTKPTSPDEARIAIRTNKSEIRNFLVNDLSSAAAGLPLKSSQWGRVTKGAALALKSRIALYNEDWKVAAAAAKEVMDLGVYLLHPSYEELFQYKGEQSSEVIFSRQYADITNARHNMTIQIGSTVAFDGWSNFLPTKDLIDSYECTDGLDIKTSPLYNEKFPWTNRDPRLHHSIVYPGREYLDGVWTSIPGFNFGTAKVYNDWDGAGAKEWNKPKSGYMFWKYQQPDDVTAKQVWEGHIDLILIRYAEVLLNYAEAKLEAGAIDQSVYDALNLIRQRPSVNMPKITSGKSPSQLRAIIRNERRVELVLEGFRLFDIRRWRTAETVMGKTLFGAPEANPATMNPIKYLTNWQINKFDPARDYLWPIPRTEIDQIGLEQNPGW